jgi:dienelactone hydrolase
VVGCIGFTLLLLLGCSVMAPAATMTVSPTPSRMDEPVAVHLRGAKPHSPVTLALRSVDATGVTWTAEATFTADADGAVDPATAAPTAGSYLGVWGMGLFAAMQPQPAAPGDYRWPTSGPATFDLLARSADRELPQAPLARTFWPQPPPLREFTVAEDGFAGTYVALAGAPRGPAVLVIGGSEGGDPSIVAAGLAARGIPALSVAYFKAPGLPDQLARIPLEYFDRPLAWLQRQPEVDPDRLWVWGASRGSEAAALVATGRPDAVHGLLAMSPSSTANCAFIPGSRPSCPDQPAWLRNAEPVPYTRQWDNPAPTDQPAAVIPVEAITGPVLTLCGGADLLWHSCRYSAAIHARLQERNVRYPRRALEYPDAGHAIDFPMPYLPGIQQAEGQNLNGATPLANERARADAWPRVLDFIRTAS